MAKELRCNDIVPGCKAVFEGKDDREVMSKATEHAKNVHDVQTLTPELQQKVRNAIHDK